MQKKTETLEFLPYSEQDPFNQSILVRSVAQKLAMREWIVCAVMRDLDTRYAITPHAVYVHPADSHEFTAEAMRRSAEVVEA